ncbi:GAP family protein [Demequina aurantiaca]|uniref:GAP family protein n=1 Tax=Demequina aurantiaca TaxID=676200 RepID=UPI003D352392
MNAVIGEILPLAVGVALTPFAVIAVILMFMTPQARSTSVAFLIGWVAGIALLVIAVAELSSTLPQDDSDGSDPTKGAIHLVLGALLLFFALKQWRGRPAAGEDVEAPAWMASIDHMTVPRSLVIGFLIAAVGPKNLIVGASAGVAIGSASLAGGEFTLVVAIYTLVAASTVLIPVIAYLVAADRLRAPLDRLRAWLQHENATIMAILLLVFGVISIGKGIGSF